MPLTSGTRLGAYEIADGRVLALVPPRRQQTATVVLNWMELMRVAR